MIANIFDKNLVKLLALFLISPGSRHLRKEIKENTEMNNMPLDNTLNKLLTLGIIKQEKKLFMIDHETEYKELLEKIKREYHGLNLPLKIFYLLLDFSDKIMEYKEIESAYLFGSYAKLIYHEKSDIDIAVIFSKSLKNNNTAEKNIIKISENLGNKYKKEVQVHFFQQKNLKEKDPLIKDILRNGKKII
jgi:predicted nucleotidyltransferase